MPKKEPTWEDIERKARQIDALAAEYDAAHPDNGHPSLSFYGLTDEELAAASRPLSEVVAEARARVTSDPVGAHGVRPADGVRPRRRVPRHLRKPVSPKQFPKRI